MQVSVLGQVDCQFVIVTDEVPQAGIDGFQTSIDHGYGRGCSRELKPNLSAVHMS